MSADRPRRSRNRIVKGEAAVRWEANLRATVPTVAFYVEMRGAVPYLVAYDSRDSTKHYGECVADK